MIDDLLDLSRATRWELRRTPTDITALAREVVAELRDGDPGRVLDIVIPDGLVAQGDSHLIRLVLQNLLSNSWKFTVHQSDPVISLSQEHRHGIDVFALCDNGAGFDMRYAHKLFDPFQRLHSASEFEGTGIGLAVVHRIITRHGGQICAESAPGRGATFRFSLTPAPAGWVIR